MLALNAPHELWRALSFTFGMTWEILWALVLGFLLSAIVQALGSHVPSGSGVRTETW